DPNQLYSDNYKARPITVLLTPPPDLVVTSVKPDAQAVGGGPFTVRWTVRNQGDETTEDADWGDALWLSDQPTLGAPGAAQWFLGWAPHRGALAPGQSYTASQTFDLSPVIEGKYVIVVTNIGPPLFLAFPETWEGPYTDNNANVGTT